ncbi:MAG: DUF3489 domain-containing protein [Sulfitobacter sp. SK025]|nr:MAG: DUF3489 domain-containing protein [Sulfitobacter sp. SK025]
MPTKITKPDAILKLISRKSGASMSELEKAVGWQAHSIRAALTGLRKRDITITREGSPTRGSIYKVTGG